jgi:hypothetical protein
MVTEKQEDLGFFIALENFSCTFSLYSNRVSLHNSLENGRINITTFIVDFAASINIFSIRLIIHFTREWIFSIMSDIIEGK